MQLRPVRRHHRPVPPVEDHGRRGDHGRQDVDRRRRRHQGEDRELSSQPESIALRPLLGERGIAAADDSVRRLACEGRAASPSSGEGQVRGRRLSAISRLQQMTAPPHPTASSWRPASRSAASSPACGRSPTWSAAARRSTSTAPPRRWATMPRPASTRFDMADHYGSAEDITGRFSPWRRGGQGGKPRRRFHQMVPDAGADDAARSCAPAIQRSLDRLGVETHRPAAVPLVDVRASRLSRRHARAGDAAARGRDRAISA